MKGVRQLLAFSVILAISILPGCSGTAAPSGSGSGAIVGSLSSLSEETGTAKILATTTSPASLQGVKVQVEGHDSLSAITDSSGNFLIKNVPPGTYNLIAEAAVADGPPLLLRRAGVQVLPGTTIALTYANGAQSPAGAVYGSVIIPGKSDLSGIRIYVPGPLPCATYTDKDGAFILNTLTPGKYEIRAQMAGYNEYVFPNVSISSGLATPLPAVTLNRIAGSVSVQGSVNISGAPPSTKLQAQLFPVNPRPGAYNIYLVDVIDGKYLFENVVPGPYMLKIGDHVDTFESGLPGTSYGVVAEYDRDMTVDTNDMKVSAITLYTGAKVTSLGSDSGFSFDNGTFVVGQNGDMYVKDINYTASAPLGTPLYFTVYSNGNNLSKIPYEVSAKFSDLRQVPTSDLVSSVTVGLSDMIVVKTSVGNYAKVRLNGYGYYGSGYLSFQWQLQPNGATQFDY